MQSYLLTTDIAMHAVCIAKAAFTLAFELGDTRTASIHIVIMDPAKQPDMGFSFEDAILFEESIGTPSNEYIAFARSKAEVSWRYKMHSQMVQQLFPHLYMQGMTVHGGGVYLYGIAAGASGVQYQMDQWFAEMIIITCRALCIGQMRKIVEAGTNFIGK